MGLASRAALGIAALALALPAAASAATTTVDPSASGTCTRGGTCATLVAAVGTAGASDVINVKPGTYLGDFNVPSGVAGLTINAEPGAQMAGGIGVAAQNFHLNGLLVARSQGNGAALTDSAGGLQVTGSVLASAVGSGVLITGGDSNVILRSTLASSLGSGDALQMNTSTGGSHSLTVDSSILVGGVDAANVRVVTVGQSGPAVLALRHVTSPRVANFGVILDSTQAPGQANIPFATPTGSITATISDSILHSKTGSAASNFIPMLLGQQSIDTPLSAANSITVTQTNTDAPVFTPFPGQGRGPQINQGNVTLTSDDKLFDSTYHLFTDAPVIGKGGVQAAGESPTDIDGDARSANGRSDLGADQFVDHAPVANGISVDPGSVRAGKPVTVAIDASDRDGHDVLGYGFNFGDGQNTTGTVASATHTYDQPGQYTVQGIVVDRFNQFSAIVTTQVTVSDGAPPEVHIDTYKLNGFRKGLVINGGAADASGLRSVEVAVTRLSGCRQFNGSTFAKNGPCKNYLFRPAAINGNVWSLSLPRNLKLPKGRYQMRVRATDNQGNVSPGFTAKAKTLIAFGVK